jgi:hypothetical protein
MIWFWRKANVAGKRRRERFEAVLSLEFFRSAQIIQEFTLSSSNSVNPVLVRVSSCKNHELDVDLGHSEDYLIFQT